MKYLKRYFWNVLIAIDQLANALLAGDPDETISSRIGKNVHRYPILKPLSKFLDLFEKDHCKKSIEEDEGDDAVFATKRKP